MFPWCGDCELPLFTADAGLSPSGATPEVEVRNLVPSLVVVLVVVVVMVEGCEVEWENGGGLAIVKDDSARGPTLLLLGRVKVPELLL